jgi:capsular polysaccharide biosynthesis protein
VSHRRVPVNLEEEDRWLFEHELEKTLPAARLLELRDVWASPDGLLFKGGRILTESFAFPSLLKQWRKRSVVKFLARSYLLKKRRTVEQDAVWIVDDWSHGYFHWLADALTRLFVIRHLVPEMVLLLPSRYSALEFVRASLEVFPVRAVEFIDPKEILRCRRLWLPTPTAPSGHYDENVIRGVRGLLVERFGDTGAAGSGERLYVSRGRAPKRRIVNEEAVVRVLREFDFKEVYAEDYSFAEQVRIASSARYLVSNHGAGLTNMLFMVSGGSILELRHETDRTNNCYFTLASALGLNYFYQTCKAEHSGEDAHTANLLVDEETLRKNLRRLVSS